MEDPVKMILDMAYETGRSQADIARAVGVSTSAVSRWYKGLRVPTMGHCIKILELADKEIDIIDKRRDSDV